jgi:ABC-type multidrug transport system ATPase subunit
MTVRVVEQAPEDSAGRDALGDHTLVVRGLSRRFKSREVVHGFDATLDRGQRLAITGPNGSGKTTILRCITGTLAPSEGLILICGAPAGSIAARRRVGASLSQERSFYLRLTGAANLRFFAGLRGGGGSALCAGASAGVASQVEAIIEELELREIAAQRVDRCSTGMIQQLAFARALLGEPPLLLLDEPTRSLDAGAVARLWSAIDRRPQLAVVIATHRPDDLDRCDARIDLGP